MLKFVVFVSRIQYVAMLFGLSSNNRHKDLFFSFNFDIKIAKSPLNVITKHTALTLLLLFLVIGIKYYFFYIYIYDTNFVTILERPWISFGFACFGNLSCHLLNSWAPMVLCCNCPVYITRTQSHTRV